MKVNVIVDTHIYFAGVFTMKPTGILCQKSLP